MKASENVGPYGMFNPGPPDLPTIRDAEEASKLGVTVSNYCEANKRVAQMDAPVVAKMSKGKLAAFALERAVAERALRLELARTEADRDRKFRELREANEGLRQLRVTLNAAHGDVGRLRSAMLGARSKVWLRRVVWAVLAYSIVAVMGMVWYMTLNSGAPPHNPGDFIGYHGGLLVLSFIALAANAD